MTFIAVETTDWSSQRAGCEVVEGIQRGLRQIFATAEAEGIATEAAARRVAEEPLQAGA